MSLPPTKQRPASVPEENVYTSIHWLVVVTYAVAATAVFLLISIAS